jgi:hypothetical protein
MAIFAGRQILSGKDPGDYVIDWLPLYNYTIDIVNFCEAQGSSGQGRNARSCSDIPATHFLRSSPSPEDMGGKQGCGISLSYLSYSPDRQPIYRPPLTSKENLQDL